MPTGNSDLPTDGRGNSVPAMKPVEGTAARTEYNTISGAKFGVGDATVMRFNPTTDCYVAFGETVSSGNMFMTAKSAEYFHVNGFDRIEVLAVSSTGQMSRIKVDY